MAAIVRPAVVLFLVLTALSGIAYPLLVTGIAQTVFPKQAAGSIVVRDGHAVGSRLIGQPFEDPRYFWTRPSATSPQPYNGLGSSGSNLGPLNPALATTIKSHIDALRAADPTNEAPIPVDLVTASASGLDPDISLAAAYYQAGRVARVRNREVNEVKALIASNARGRMWGFLGEPRVNVLELNLSLDHR
jgi:potassium-transporting ATPase KdpC subunit